MVLDRGAGRGADERASHAMMARHHRPDGRSLESAVAMTGLLLHGERAGGQKQRAGEDRRLEPG